MPLVSVTNCKTWILVAILGLGLFQGSGYSRAMHIQVSLDAGVLGYSSFRHRDISGYSQAGFSVVSYPDPFQIVMRDKNLNILDIAHSSGLIFEIYQM